jgi:high-affinity iron transporter
MLNKPFFAHFFALFLLLTTCSVRADVQTLLQMVENMAVDFPEAVQGGQVINEVKYAQILESAQHIKSEINQLDDSAVLDDLKGIATELGDAVVSKAPPFMIEEQTRALRRLIMAGYTTDQSP